MLSWNTDGGVVGENVCHEKREEDLKGMGFEFIWPWKTGGPSVSQTSCGSSGSLRSWAYLTGSQRLSARDALHLAIMERNRVSRILSFDTGFDEYPGIKRLSAI